MRGFPNMITGALMSLFGFTIVFALALIIPEYFYVPYYRSEITSRGLSFFIIDVIIGAIGGLLGGDISDRQGPVVGGVISGILVGLIMIGFVISY